MTEVGSRLLMFIEVHGRYSDMRVVAKTKGGLKVEADSIAEALRKLADEVLSVAASEGAREDLPIFHRSELARWRARHDDD